MGVDVNITGVPQFDKMEVVKVIDIDVPKLSSQTNGNATLAHGLNFTPIAIVFVKIGSIFLPLPFTTLVLSGTGAGSVQSHYTYSVDNTNIIGNIYSPDFSGTGGFASDLSSTFRFYLLRYTAQTT